MSRVIVLQHMDREGPGLIEPACRDRGLDVTLVHLYRGDAVPAALGRDDVLVIMGGSMGVGDVGDDRYPFLSQEVELLRKVLATSQPVLGVCLGAQLLAHAAGSRVYPNRRTDAEGREHRCPEVGFGTVRLVGRARERALAGLDGEIPVLHWHGDTFDLPPGAVHLAENDACRNQGFRIGRRAFGLQFHVEADAALARRWAAEDADFVVRALGPGGPAKIVAESDTRAAPMRESGERLIRNILSEMLAP